MKFKKLSKFVRENSRMLKKVGITFVIPIFLSITGAIIIMSASWNLLAQSYAIGTTVFSKPSINLDQVSFNINNKEVYRPDLGQLFGTIRIPSVEIERPLIHGDGDDELKKGVGHYAGSTLPGEGGNVVLAGHRDTVFKKLEGVKVGDEVFVDTDWGKYKYKVSNIRITNPDDTSVTEPTDFEKLTVYTCYPFNFVGRAPERYIVECEFLEIVQE
ncbi:MAG: class D sortase [Peptostreptococcaceae bacterium]